MTTYARSPTLEGLHRAVARVRALAEAGGCRAMQGCCRRVSTVSQALRLDGEGKRADHGVAASDARPGIPGTRRAAETPIRARWVGQALAALYREVCFQICTIFSNANGSISASTLRKRTARTPL